MTEPEQKTQTEIAEQQIAETILTMPKDPVWVQALKDKLQEYKERPRAEVQDTAQEYSVLILSALIASGSFQPKILALSLSKARGWKYDVILFAGVMRTIDEYTKHGYSNGRILPGLERIVSVTGNDPMGKLRELTEAGETSGGIRERLAGLFPWLFKH